MRAATPKARPITETNVINEINFEPFLEKRNLFAIKNLKFKFNYFYLIKMLL